MTNFSVKKYLEKNTESASLAVFRIFFGFMMFISIIRFWLKGWIHQLYIEPDFFFSYYGFEWVKPIGQYTYVLFFICGLASFFVMIGYKYRLAIITLFLSFTYIELMDKTNYLNHYYFVSLICFILMFLPASSYFSVDARQNSKIAFQRIPQWTVDCLKLMLFIVYFYAGLAKLNSDWLFRASPLSIWLPIKNTMPFIGGLMPQTWFHIAMSWSGALYDLVIPFLLINKKTRNFAFFLVVIFHVFTRILFSIGMFPYIMIVGTIIFFDATIHHKILQLIASIFNISKAQFNNIKSLQVVRKQSLKLPVLVVFFALQLLLPWRYLLYPSELFWSEEGYRFSWRVMLVEKAGYAEFKVVDKQTNKQYYIDNKEYLTSLQEKQMSFQSDFILEYAHYLGGVFKDKGIKNPQVFVDNYVTLNGRLSSVFVKPNVNLYQEKESLKHKEWLTKFNHKIKIKGL